MKQLLLTTLLALTCASAGAQSLSWSLDPRGVAIAADAAENVYTVDGDVNPAGDITLTKTAPNGVRLFAVKYDNTDATRHEVPSWVDVDSTGGAYVSGTSRSGFSNPVNAHALLMRFSAKGSLRWRVVLGSDFDGGSSFKVVRDAADNAYVLGVGPTPDGARMRIHKVTPEGVASLLWHDPAGIGLPTNFKWGLDGKLVVAARSITGLLGGAARVGLDGLTLDLITQVPAFSAVDAAADAQGNLYIVSTDPALGQGRLQRVSASPGGAWLRNDPIRMIRVDATPDGGVVVGGTPAAGFGTAFARYTADGTQLWANRDADGPLFNLLGHGQMRLDTASNAYLAASTLGQMAVTRVNADGSTGWTLQVPFGNGVALAFGATSNAVYLVGGQTARIDQGGFPPPPLAPDLVTTLSQTVAGSRFGPNVTLNTVVRNLGNAPASNVSLEQAQSGSVVLVSADSNQGSCVLAQPLRCSFGTLAPGASVTVTQRLRAPTARGFNTAATAATSTPETLTSNNTATLMTVLR